MAYFVKKRLQVFVSSTFLDLKDERQAAVKAILEAGHIPAGMELFTSGDESQLEVIKQWIEASDVYLLILGGRYGSLDDKSKKSYTHIEYEYAMELKKPSFACIMNEEYLDKKIRKDEKIANKDIYEQNNQEKFKEFKSLVMSHMVSQCSSLIEIENAILKKMNELERNINLTGWIRASEGADHASLSDKVARISKENRELREYINTINIERQNSSPSLKIHGTNFHEIVKILNTIFLSKEHITDIVSTSSAFSPDIDSDAFYNRLIEFIKAGDIKNLVDFLCVFSDFLVGDGIPISKELSVTNLVFSESNLKILFDLDIIVKINRKKAVLKRTLFDDLSIRATSNGATFIKYLRIENLKKDFQ